MQVHYPEGFQRTRWVIFTVLGLAYMLVFFHRMAPAAVSSSLMVDFGTTAAALGTLSAMYLYPYTAMQIPAGLVADTLGPRVSVSLGGIVSGVGSIIFGLSDTFAWASTGRFLVGLGVSVIFIGMMRSNAEWFSSREDGRISGLTILLGNVGSILAAAPLVMLLGAFTWREVFIGIGLAALFLSLMTWLFVRNSPVEAGFPSVRELEGLAPRQKTKLNVKQALKAVLTNRLAWPGFWVNLGVTGNMFAFVGLWGDRLLHDVHGLSLDEGANYYTLSLIGFAVGCLIMGSVSDAYGKRKPFIMGAAFVSLLAWLALLYAPWQPGWSAYLLYGFLGFAASGFVLGYSVAKEVSEPAHAGMAIGLVNTGLFLGAALMQPLFGWVLDQTWNGAMQGELRIYQVSDYENALLVSAGLALMAFLVSFKIKETHCKNITHD